MIIAKTGSRQTNLARNGDLGTRGLVSARTHCEQAQVVAFPEAGSEAFAAHSSIPSESRTVPGPAQPGSVA